MEIYRTTQELEVCGEVFDAGDWRDTTGRIRGGMILTKLTDVQHDCVLNIAEDMDPLGLRGYLVTLIVKDADENDPKQINLMAIPTIGQIIRHMDRYYYVMRVLQSTNYSVAVFVERQENINPFSSGGVLP